MAKPAGEAGDVTVSPRVPEAESSGLPNEVQVPVADDLEEDEVVTEEGGLHYLLERVEVVGNKRTKLRLIKRLVPIEPGSTFDVDDPQIQALRYRLLGTGWYDRVDLRLERGKRPGWVVLVIEVEERQTIVFQQLAAGVGWTVEGVKEKQGNSPTPTRQAEPYIGLALADTNFLGSGHMLGGQLLLAPDQQGVALNYFDPLLGNSRWSLRATTSFVNGREYFGGDSAVYVDVPCDEKSNPEAQEKCYLKPPVATVDYYRAGLGVGTARDVGFFTRLSLDWHGDIVDVPPGSMPYEASEARGVGPGSRSPIDFGIDRGWSFVSMFSIGFTYDKRDSAALPRRGILANFSGDLSSPLMGSSYQFVRLQASINHWSQTRWGHTLRFGAFAGAVYGDPPFFYKFFVADLTDLMPSRILGLNLDHRPAPNLFGVFECGRPAFQPGCGTAIAVMRQEELAARVDMEYVWPAVRGRKKFLRAVDVFGLIGLYAMADPHDLKVAIPGYHGIAKLPVDLTFDLGVRLDTDAGVFQIGLAKLLWLPAGVKKIPSPTPMSASSTR
ncbi:MAG: BamA/TamA family outer membrane protein [Myxococcales bacterium]